MASEKACGQDVPKEKRKKRKLPKSPSIGTWLSRLWLIQMTDYYGARNHVIGAHSVMWMESHSTVVASHSV